MNIEDSIYFTPANDGLIDLYNFGDKVIHPLNIDGYRVKSGTKYKLTVNPVKTFFKIEEVPTPLGGLTDEMCITHLKNNGYKIFKEL